MFAAGSAQGGAGMTDGFVASFDRDGQLTGARALGTIQGDGFLGATSVGGAGVAPVGASGDAQAVAAKIARASTIAAKG